MTLGLAFDATEHAILCAVQELATSMQSLRQFVNPSCESAMQVSQAITNEVVHWRTQGHQPSPPTSPTKWSFDSGETSRDMSAQRECAMDVLRRTRSSDVAVHGAWAYLLWVPEGRTFVPMEIDILAKDPEQVATAMVDALTKTFGTERCFSIAEGTHGCLRVQGNLHHIADIGPFPQKEEDAFPKIVVATGWAPLEGVPVITIDAWRQRTETMIEKPSCSFRKERDEARIATLQRQREDLERAKQSHEMEDRVRNARIEMEDEFREQISELLCQAEALRSELHERDERIASLLSQSGGDDDASSETREDAWSSSPSQANTNKTKKKKKKKKNKSKSKGGDKKQGGKDQDDEMDMLDACIETAEWGRLAAQLEEQLQEQKASGDKLRDEAENERDRASNFDLGLSTALSIMFDMSRICESTFQMNEDIVFKLLDTISTCVFDSDELDQMDNEREKQAAKGFVVAINVLRTHFIVTQAVLLNMASWCQLSVGGLFPVKDHPEHFSRVDYPDHSKVQYQRGQTIVSGMETYPKVFNELNRKRIDVVRQVMALVAGIKSPFLHVTDTDGKILRLSTKGSTSAFLDRTGVIRKERQDCAKDIEAGKFEEASPEKTLFIVQPHNSKFR